MTIHAGPYIRGTIDGYRERAASHRAQWVHLLKLAEEQRLLAEAAQLKAAELAAGTDYEEGR
jgi:hypothetical protein